MKEPTKGWSVVRVGSGRVMVGGGGGGVRSRGKENKNNWHEMNCRQSHCFAEHKTVRRG